MNGASRIQQILLLSGMVALLLLALLFDYSIVSMQLGNSQGAGLESFLIVSFSLFQLLLVIGGMVLFWYVVSIGDGIRGTKIIYLVVGLLIVFATPLINFLPVGASVYSLVTYIQPGTYVFLVGALLGAIGLLGLLIKKSNRSIRPDSET